MIDWRDISYLQKGSHRQRAAYATLASLGLFDVLRPFDPALVSTVCLQLDRPGSDLDVICELTAPVAFAARVQRAFGNRPGFELTDRGTTPFSMVARFDAPAFPVEVFAEARPVEEQYAWRHLSVMARLLRIAPEFRAPVRQLKGEGLATEEAFAVLLGLEGDPYEAILALEEATEAQLRERCRRVL